MAIIKFEIPPTYTAAEKLAMWEQCEMTIAVGGQSYEIDGVVFTNANLNQVRQRIFDLKREIAAEQSNAPGFIIARKGSWQ